METYEPVKVDFADFRIVKTRSVMQIICEVPIEHGDQVLSNLGGIPQPSTPKRCALVRIND